jgi:hypothetical protein
VALPTEKVAAVLPLKVTPVAPVKLVPVITTTVPETPDAGAKLEIVGADGGGGLLFEEAVPHAAMVSKRAAAKSP